ncbi:hypothetical protein AWB78_04618 [Caballeronia calidae]|uniref:TagK domain-containing protein n=2 Tax=Caballeronia calidae TaxID=1777139 RepID=A0A158D1A8_9BURK|nr:hypothetical protein AWB78_04618 [Caballeronia calidae]
MKERMEPVGLVPAESRTALDDDLNFEDLEFASLLHDGAVLKARLRGGATVARAPAFVDGSSGDTLSVLAASCYAALENARILPAHSWDFPQTSAAQSIAASETHAPDPDPEGHVPISEWLGAVETIEEAFGPLVDINDAMAAPRAVPDILEVFAPGQYQVSDAEGSACSAPQLARRDHHTLAIDSPMQQTNSEARHLEQYVSDNK